MLQQNISYENWLSNFSYFYNNEYNLLSLIVDIESFWTEGHAGQILNSGHELAIYVLRL